MLKFCIFVYFKNLPVGAENVGSVNLAYISKVSCRFSQQRCGRSTPALWHCSSSSPLSSRSAMPPNSDPRWSFASVSLASILISSSSLLLSFPPDDVIHSCPPDALQKSQTWSLLCTDSCSTSPSSLFPRFLSSFPEPFLAPRPSLPVPLGLLPLFCPALVVVVPPVADAVCRSMGGNYTILQTHTHTNTLFCDSLFLSPYSHKCRNEEVLPAGQ